MINEMPKRYASLNVRYMKTHLGKKCIPINKKLKMEKPTLGFCRYGTV